MNAQMKKGVLEMCILHTISKEEMYGYDIMKKMTIYFPEVNESTFYSILRRLNKEGAAETYFGKESNGPKRKYYRITENGKKKLKDDVQSWKQINGIVNTIGVE